MSGERSLDDLLRLHEDPHYRLSAREIEELAKHTHRLLTERDALAAKVERVEALANKWAEMDWGHEAASIRAALRDHP